MFSDKIPALILNEWDQPRRVREIKNESFNAIRIQGIGDFLQNATVLEFLKERL